MSARYIDRALAGFLAPRREAYREGLAALDHYARSSRGVPPSPRCRQPIRTPCWSI
jgi:hypothetical protein